MPAREQPHLPDVVAELHQQHRGEQLGRAALVGVEDDAPLQARGDALEVGLVEDRLVEGRQHRRGGAHRGQPVPLDVAEDHADAEGAGADVEQVAADARAPLRGAVEPGAGQAVDVVGQ